MPDGTLPLSSNPDDAQPSSRERSGPDPRLGTLLDGRYRLERVLGQGGMGTVYEAENVRIGRRVAVKVLHPEFARSPVEVERFEREARISVRLSSPHVVEVLDFGRTEGGELFLVMELLRGESVAARLAREGRFSPERATELLRQLLVGLVAAHEAGIVHRDLKPENLWLAPAEGGERLKILDFGIAKVADLPQSAARTQVGLVIGTPEFLSPEQAVGGEVDARSDLYSAGIIAWVLVAGRHPFAGRDVRAIVRAHAFDPVPSPERELPELAAHAPLLRFLARATEKDPAARAASASELLAILEGREARLRWTSTARSRTGPQEAAASPSTPARARTLSGLLRPTAAIPRATGATVLVTELVGFAEREGRLGPDELAGLLVRHDELVLPAIRAFRGRRVRSRRETVLAAFPSPTDAVLCGMAIQDRLATPAAAVPDGPLALRIGIHLGESRAEGGDLVGEAVALAIAVRDASDPGSVTLSRTVHLAMNRSEVPVAPRSPIPHPRRDEPLPLYLVERLPGPLPYGGHAAGRVAAADGGARVLAPLADGLASIEDGAAEGRLRATLRVTTAGSGLVSLGCIELGARAATGVVAAVRWAGWRGRSAPRLERLLRALDRVRAWVRVHRPILRAGLIRPLR